MSRIQRGLHQRGAALLAAMLTVTLVATFAATAMWQQWRAIEIEAAERARVQSAWILMGALDWSRLILAEDASGGSADHLAEPWAVPLEEARLSTFLAAERNVAQVDDASTDTTDAFLSGNIIDLQSRLNLMALTASDADNEAHKEVQAQFSRLFSQLGLPPGELSALTQALRQAQGKDDANAPLLPQTLEQLTWLGISPASVAALAPHATLLPERSTRLNLNTADATALMAGMIARGTPLNDAALKWDVVYRCVLAGGAGHKKARLKVLAVARKENADEDPAARQHSQQQEQPQ